jgi:predicted nucleotidyltransferase component of viral defense system
MKSSIEQSTKEKLKALTKERETSFAQLWNNLILERFLARLSQSPYKDRFVLKGGTLLAKYLPLGRETKDLDFFIQQLSNKIEILEGILCSICSIDINDSFIFEVLRVDILEHVHMAYTGAQVSLMAKFGATRTTVRMDLGFGDIVEAIDYSMSLTATRKGPLFENTISLYCYPKEFIFAEKLETIVFRGAENTRMKDFHDLYSLISIGNLREAYAEQAIQLVFKHRSTPLKDLPIVFDSAAIEQLEKGWRLYHRRLKTTKHSLFLPTSIEDLTKSINQWLSQKTALCKKQSDPRMSKCFTTVEEYHANHQT